MNFDRVMIVFMHHKPILESYYNQCIWVILIHVRRKHKINLKKNREFSLTKKKCTDHAPQIFAVVHLHHGTCNFAFL